VVVRTVYLKLHDDLATPDGRAALAASARENLATIPGVLHVDAGVPAEPATAGAWDVALHIRFASMDHVEAYIVDPGHVAWVRDVLAPRTAFRKAWNFDVSA
jgi:hypothetical protein